MAGYREPETAEEVARRRDAERIAQLEAENARLRDRASLLESRCGHLMVDAERREERALRQAGSCEWHGHEIQRLRHLASWCWSDARRQDEARMSIVSALALLMTRLPLPDEIRSGLGKCIDAQKRRGREPGFPTFADCQRAGGCDHPALSPSLSDEVRKHRTPPATPAPPALFDAQEVA